MLASYFAPAANAAESAIKIIPQPKTIQWRGGDLNLDKSIKIMLGDPARESDQFAADLLIREFKSQLGFQPALADKAGPRTIALGLASDSAVSAFAAKQGVEAQAIIAPEGYVLSVGSNGILLAGADESGTFYAVQSLRQMIRAYKNGAGEAVIPKVRMDDWPSFPFRGITDDISRGPIPTMETIKTTLERLAEFKINKFNFYIEHVFCYEKRPDIGPQGGCLTAGDLREVEAHAAKYHIELIGGLQSFGHQKYMLSLKQYNHLAENRVMPWTVTPSKKETYELFDDLYSEIAPAVSSELFNISCDETWDLGGGQSKKMVEQKGIEWVYASHINKIHDLLAKRGKRVMMWADIALKHPGILNMLPDDLIFLPWRYGADDNFNDMLEPIKATGHDFIVAPGVSCWSRIYPNMATARKNISHFARDGAIYGAWGVLNTTWDDDGENLFGYNWLPLAWGGEASWNPLDHNYEDFAAAFSQVFYGTPDDIAIQGLSQFEEAEKLMDFKDLGDGRFWEWPVAGSLNNMAMAKLDAQRLLKIAEEAEKRLLEAKGEATANAENLDYPLFSARRLKNMAERRLAYFKAAELYKKAYDHRDGDPEKVAGALKNVGAILQSEVDSLNALWEEYKAIYLRENRPYWLEMNDEKYRGLSEKIGKVAGTMERLHGDLGAGQNLPDNAAVGLPFPGRQ